MGHAQKRKIRAFPLAGVLAKTPVKALPSDVGTVAVDQQATASHLKVRQLRLSKRCKLSIPAWAAFGETGLPVTVSNISSTGIGYQGQTGIAEGTKVTIHFPGERVVTGTVVWVQDGRGGIKLSDVLAGHKSSLRSTEPDGQGVFRDTDAIEKARPTFKPLRTLKVWLASWANRPSSRSASAKMIERACRKQGFSWLADEEFISFKHHSKD